MPTPEEKAQQINDVETSPSSVPSTSGVNRARTGAKSDAPLTQARSPDVPVRKFPKTLHLGWGHTYFVRHGDAIKIGHSAIPKNRIPQIQSGFPVPLDVLAIVPNTIISEPDAHELFAHLRIKNEWFRVAPDLLAFIEQVKREAAQLPKQAKPIISREFDKIRCDLIAKRLVHGAKSAIGFRCSNLVKQIDNRAETTEEAKIELEKSMRQQVADLARLSAQ